VKVLGRSLSLLVCADCGDWRNPDLYYTEFEKEVRCNACGGSGHKMAPFIYGPDAIVDESDGPLMEVLDDPLMGWCGFVTHLSPPLFVTEAYSLKVSDWDDRFVWKKED
jgi:hypothetical protein